MKSIIENYINGNLTDAKTGAKRHSWRALFLYLREHHYSESEARAIADYLKGNSVNFPPLATP